MTKMHGGGLLFLPNCCILILRLKSKSVGLKIPFPSLGTYSFIVLVVPTQPLKTCKQKQANALSFTASQKLSESTDLVNQHGSNAEHKTMRRHGHIHKVFAKIWKTIMH